MHYPHKVSNRKPVRKIGFRARMRTKEGPPDAQSQAALTGRSVNSV